MIGPLTGSPTRPSTKCFHTCQDVLDISQIAMAFHGISQPFFNQARLPQHSKRPFLNSAYRSFSNTSIACAWEDLIAQRPVRVCSLPLACCVQYFLLQSVTRGTVLRHALPCVGALTSQRATVSGHSCQVLCWTGKRHSTLLVFIQAGLEQH